MISFRLSVAALLSTLALTSVASPARATFGYSRTCNGSPTRWEDRFTMFRNRSPSMPTGSDRHVALTNAEDQWGLIMPIMDPPQFYDGNTIEHGNGRSEAAVVPVSELGSDVLGRTRWFTNTDCTGIPVEKYIEADVMGRSDLSYAPQDGSFRQYDLLKTGPVTLVHEFGHVMGLAHTPQTAAEFNIMRPFQPAYPLHGAWGAGPYPDDAHGVRNLYSDENPVEPPNYFVFAQKMDPQTGEIVPSEIQIVAHVGDRSAPITVSRTNGNSFQLTYGAGTTQKTGPRTLSFRIFINSTGNPGQGIEADIFNGNATLDAYGEFTETKFFSAPLNVPLGNYYIFWEIGGLLSEDLSDNQVFCSRQLRITG